MEFESQSFNKRLKSMLAVDFKRIFKTPLFYIMLGICLIVPVLTIVMTTMMDGTVTVDPNTGVETVVEGFDNVWQSVSSLSDSSSAMSMDITTMCNMNMVYFFIMVFVCLFVASEFRSGYAKNLFTYRAKKNDYVVSKTITLGIASVFMIIAYFAGAMFAGKISGLPFDMVGFSQIELIMCLLAKVFLVLIFVALSLLGSSFAKEKLWLSILCSLFAGMLLYMMIPMMTPLNSSLMNVMMCGVGGVIFSIGIGAVSNLILKKTDIV